MTNLEKYTDVFASSLEIDKNVVEDDEYQKIEGWDSVGHMNLISNLEDAFDIMLDTDDILAFNSFKVGIEILKKYDVDM